MLYLSIFSCYNPTSFLSTSLLKYSLLPNNILERIHNNNRWILSVTSADLIYIAIMSCADFFFFFNNDMTQPLSLQNLTLGLYFSMCVTYQKFHLDKLRYIFNIDLWYLYPTFLFLYYQSHVSVQKLIIKCFIVSALLTLSLFKLPYFHSNILVI